MMTCVVSQEGLSQTLKNFNDLLFPFIFPFGLSTVMLNDVNDLNCLEDALDTTVKNVFSNNCSVFLHCLNDGMLYACYVRFRLRKSYGRAIDVAFLLCVSLLNGVLLRSWRCL